MTTVRRTADADAGFTLLELVVVMAISGVLVSIGIFGFASWQATSEQQGSADAVQSQLRNASTRAISEGRTYCVEVAPDGRSYSLYQYVCSSTAPGQLVLGPRRTQSSEVTLQASITGAAGTCPSGSTCIYFRPRGTATPAAINVQSTKRSQVYTINVEGLTARVYS